jgi:hypothetical protein
MPMMVGHGAIIMAKTRSDNYMQSQQQQWQNHEQMHCFMHCDF